MDEDTHHHRTNPTPQQGYARRRGFLRREMVAPFAIALIATIWAGLITGRGLAIYLAAPLLACIYVPFLTVGARKNDSLSRYTGGGPGRGFFSRFQFTPRHLQQPPPQPSPGVPGEGVRALACAMGIAVALLPFDIGADVTVGEWFRCVVVISSLIVAITAIGNLLALLHLPDSIAATFTSIIALFWMTWPVWMSHSLTQARVDWLVPAHPLLAINGVLEHLGSWDHAPIAYRQLTILNQDIPFRLPTSILPATIVHLAIGTLLLFGQPRNTVIPTSESSIAA